FNECRPPLQVCGLFAGCENTYGSYLCYCNHGFELVTGGTMFKNEGENTCQEYEQICKSHSICITLMAATPASASPALSSTRKARSYVNECTGGGALATRPITASTSWEAMSATASMSGSWSLGPPIVQTTLCMSGACVGTNGITFSHCRWGCLAWKKERAWTGHGPDPFFLSPDVDECSSGQHQCHSSTDCINTQGFYMCRCRQGWVPKPGHWNNQTTTICEDLLPHLDPTSCHQEPGAWPQQRSGGGSPTQHTVAACLPHASPLTVMLSDPPTPQSLSHFFEKLQGLGRNFTSAQQSIQDLTQAVDDLLENPGDLETLPPSEQHCVATNLLAGLEHALTALGKALPKGPLIFSSPAGTELSMEVQEQGDRNVTLSQNQAQIMLNWDVTSESGSSGPSVVGLVSLPRMGKLLTDAPVALETEKRAVLHETYKHFLQNVSSILFSDVISAFMGSSVTPNLNTPVTFVFKHSATSESRQKIHCVYWEHDQNGCGHWTTKGCRMVSTRDTKTTCQCTHLSSFAVLMASYSVQSSGSYLSCHPLEGRSVLLWCPQLGLSPMASLQLLQFVASPNPCLQMM
ncbi:Adhesion G protein-coupled receptor E2, partial [Galemys pyrenaicus]